MRRVLITGDAGFVGREFHRQLADCDITGIDIKNGADCRDFFKEQDHQVYDLVVHLAAIVGGRSMIESEPLHVATDLAIDADFFNWVERTRQQRVIYYSSSAAYPVALQETPGHLLTESDISLEHIDAPDMTYGWSKLTGELLAEFCSAAVHVFRPFSGYGGEQDLTYPFPSYIARAVTRVDPFPVWGPGTQTRDFIHVEDVVSATLTAVAKGVMGPVNLCTGRATSFDQLASMTSLEAGYTPQIEHDFAAPVGVMHRVGDPTAMNAFYTPRISLEEGIAQAVKDMT